MKKELPSVCTGPWCQALQMSTDAAVILNNYTFTIKVNDLSNTEKRFKEDKSVALVSPELV